MLGSGDEPDPNIYYRIGISQISEKDSVLPYIKIVPERFAPTRPNYLCFVSTPTIDIEPFFRQNEYVVLLGVGLKICGRRTEKTKI